MTYQKFMSVEMRYSFFKASRHETIDDDISIDDPYLCYYEQV